MLFKTLCTTLLASVSAYSNQKPPTSGKYFYADLSQADYYGMHYVKMQLGSEKQQMHLSLSSDQFMTGVYENTCIQMSNGDACNIPDPYRYADSTSA